MSGPPKAAADLRKYLQVSVFDLRTQCRAKRGIIVTRRRAVQTMFVSIDIRPIRVPGDRPDSQRARKNVYRGSAYLHNTVHFVHIRRAECAVVRIPQVRICYCGCLVEHKCRACGNGLIGVHAGYHIVAGVDDFCRQCNGLSGPALILNVCLDPHCG